jgi:MFS family permease
VPTLQKANDILISSLLIISGVFVACNIYTLIPIYLTISESWNASTSILSWGSTSFTLFYAFGLLLFGPISDRIGRKPVILVGMLLFSVTSLYVSFSRTPTELIISRGLQGFAGGSFAPVAFAYIFDLFNGKFRTLVLALINTGFLVAGIAGQLISSGLTASLDWTYVFYFFSLTYFIIFLLSLRILPKLKGSLVNQSLIPVKQLLTLYRTKNLTFCYIISFSLLLTTVAFYDAVSQYFSTSITPDELFILRFVGLLGTILSLFGGAIISKIKEKGSLIAGFSLLISSLIPMITFPSYGVIIFCSIILIAAISILIPTIITVIGTLGEEARGSAIALYSFTLLVGASFGSLLTSLFDFQGVLTFLLAFSLVNIFITSKISYPISTN